MEHITEGSILAQLFQRDETALREIQNLYGKLCYKLADEILDCKEDSEECVNDMLMRIWNTIPSNRPRNLQAYVVTVLRHLAFDKYKAVTAKKRGGKQFETALEELGDTLASADDPNHTVDEHELTKAIEHFLDTLSPQTRNIFLRRYFMSESVKEIAERYDLSVSAAKISLMRTRDKLQKFLRKEGLL